MTKSEDGKHAAKSGGAGGANGRESGPVIDAERAKVIDLTVATIEKQFGKGAIMRMGEQSQIPPVETIPSGSLALASALSSTLSSGSDMRRS